MIKSFFLGFLFYKRVQTTKLFESPFTDSKKYLLHSNCEVRLWFISVCQFENNKVTDTASNLTSKHPQVSENDFAKEITPKTQSILGINDRSIDELHLVLLFNSRKKKLKSCSDTWECFLVRLLAVFVTFLFSEKMHGTPSVCLQMQKKNECKDNILIRFSKSNRK